MHKDLGVFWLYYSQDSLQLFSWITVLCVARLEAWCERQKVKFSKSLQTRLKVARVKENNIIPR